jgi:ligand-binding sensor domain-containing protein/signal transduction histidine kinase
MTTVYKIIIFIFLYFLLPCISNAQKKNLHIAHLTTDDGLSHNHIYEILQDRRGFMWFATQDGLNRYDGYSFVVYKNNANDSSTISNNFILDLIEDNLGNLWLGTATGGVNKFDPVTGHVTRYLHDPGNPNSISDNEVESILQDSYGNFWFGTENNGLDKFELTTETFTHFAKDIDNQAIGRATKLIEDKHKNIWFTGERGLFHLNPQTGEITRPPATKSLLSADYIYEDAAGIFWILTWNPAALIKYNPATEQLTKYPCDAIGLWSCNLVDDGKQGFWIPSKKGLCYFNKQTEQFKYIFQQDDTTPDGINDNFVSSIHRDRAGLLWLGTEKGGINIVNFQNEQFDFYGHKQGNPNSLLPGKVTAVHTDDDGVLWLGYTPLALSRIDRNSGKTTHYTPKPGDKHSLGKGATIKCIFRDSRGYLWLGGWESGLTQFDERTGLFKQYLPKQGNTNSLISDKVYCILEDKNRNLWIGQYGGLSRFNLETEKFTNYQHNPDNPKSLGGRNVYCIYQDHSGVFWIGTTDGVLNRFDADNETFVNHPLNPASNSLKGVDIVTIYESRSGTLWLGRTDGLYRYNKENGTFTHYTEIQGLSDNFVEGILEDDAGMLWISTLNGLSLFDPQNETFRNYDKTDGLQDNYFSEGCCKKGKNGELFFGCSKGLVAFLPGNIRNNPYVPPIVLTDFRLFGKSVPINNNSVRKKTINQTDTLTLHYKQNNISFEFAALSYAAPEKNQYRYILEGFDTDWHNVGSTERLAVYTNLPVGSYVFRVQGTNHDGVWNRKGKTIYLEILTPWWQTWLFRSMVIILLLALGYAGFNLRVRNIKKRSQEFERVVEERTAQLQTVNEQLEATNKELAGANKRFQAVNTKLEAANKELEAFSYSISHDLRAPLRSIDGFSQILLEDYSDKILDQQGQNYLQRVRTGAQYMGQLIEGMLKLSRVSRGELTIRRVNLSSIVKEIANDLCNSNPDRNVKFVIQNEITANADERLIQSVLENLIGNAWKYTSKRPSAHIEFGMQQQNGKPGFFVRDDGAGFEMKYAQKLFSVFQRLHDSKEFPGTGIGLASVQRIIHRHGGMVWAEGEVEKGATFYFTLV